MTEAFKPWQKRMKAFCNSKRTGFRKALEWAEKQDTEIFDVSGSGWDHAEAADPKLHDFLSSREEVLRRSGEVLGLLTSGELEVTVQQTLPLTEEGVRQGHRLLEARGTVGKILFSIE